MAIPKGITRADVEQAIRDYRAGVDHPYGRSTRYDLVLPDGQRYPPKAIVGLAARRLNDGEPLDPERQFGGGEGPSAANRVLRELGYTVVPKGAPVTTARSDDRGRRDWDESELVAIVAAYFDLYHRDVAGEPVVKREAIRVLQPRLQGRSRGSVEYKFENISAVLEEEGLEPLRGYVPRHNYQRALREAVLVALDAGEREWLLADLSAAPEPPTPTDLSALEVPPPRSRRSALRDRGRSRSGPWRRAARDASSKALGDAGEAWVCDVERHVLSAAGRADLAEQVEWVARTQGDGLGYDVHSFDTTGAERWIEVKTTNARHDTPFLLTPNELAVWRSNLERFELRRVFDFSKRPRFYRLRGDPDAILELETSLWQARPT